MRIVMTSRSSTIVRNQNIYSPLFFLFTAPLIFHLIGILDNHHSPLHRTPATMGVNGKKDHVPVPMDKLAMAKQMAAKLTAKTATINKSEVSFVTICQLQP